MKNFTIGGKRIWVAGHRGLAGSAIVRRLANMECDVLIASRGSLDLTDQKAVQKWVSDNRPDAVIVAAAKVGGILANKERPAEFLYENLMIESNVIHASFVSRVEKLLFLGSSCIYPKLAAQPMNESALLTGPLEPTNEYYAIAKIAGVKLCEAYYRQYGCNFISLMPTNLYGPGDNFDLAGSHVLPALLRKIHEAKHSHLPEVSIWGTGLPLREFLHVDDLADACVFMLERYSSERHVNIGTGQEVSIKELAELLIEIIGYQGELVFDPTKPDGTPRKLQDIGRQTELGWRPRISLRNGIAQTYKWYCDNEQSARL